MSQSLVNRKLGDILELLTTARFLNDATFMAAGNSSLTTDDTNALQSVANEVENKLLIIQDRIEELMEELK